jgi:hypothetical protein
MIGEEEKEKQRKRIKIDEKGKEFTPVSGKEGRGSGSGGEIP